LCGGFVGRALAHELQRCCELLDRCGQPILDGVRSSDAALTLAWLAATPLPPCTEKRLLCGAHHFNMPHC